VYVGSTARFGATPYRHFVAITNHDAADQSFFWQVAVDI
jgi:hypothetical protein